MKTALIIAGSDPSSGAGVQADIRTFSYFGVYATSVISTLTVQNSTKLKTLFTIPDEVFEEQLEFLTYDIKPEIVKVGILYGSKKIQTVANYIRINKKQIEGFVLDPIIESSSGFIIMDQDDILNLKSHLLPLATIVTPNIPEAEHLTGKKITNIDQMMEAAAIIKSLGPKNVLIKGGHLPDIFTNIFYDGKKFEELEWKRYPKQVHGTGCALSSAIASGLAKGYSVIESVEIAHEFMQEAIKSSIIVGEGMEVIFHI